jgi:hypothetical protein
LGLALSPHPENCFLILPHFKTYQTTVLLQTNNAKDLHHLSLKNQNWVCIDNTGSGRLNRLPNFQSQMEKISPKELHYLSQFLIDGYKQVPHVVLDLYAVG